MTNLRSLRGRAPRPTRSVSPKIGFQSSDTHPRTNPSSMRDASALSKSESGNPAAQRRLSCVLQRQRSVDRARRTLCSAQLKSSGCSRHLRSFMNVVIVILSRSPLESSSGVIAPRLSSASSERLTEGEGVTRSSMYGSSSFIKARRSGASPDRVNTGGQHHAQRGEYRQ